MVSLPAISPELELHGSDASLSSHRITGAVCLFRTDADPETVTALPDEDQGNRFKQYPFPGLWDRIEGRPCPHPGLDDGDRVQLFTEAAARSARQDGWVEVSAIEDELN